MARRDGLRIAMWSGPRNISTAMMRSWGNRGDTIVCDEPFYAFYLKATGKPHPGAEEVIRHHETDWRKVVAWLTGPIPGGKDIFYQKQMTHHLLPEIDRRWLLKVTNCFLIRDPREMLTSYLKIVPNPTDEDTGYPQQLEIFRFVRERTGKTPPVLDTRDVLQNPERMLRALCEALDVPFQEAMLSWPPGLRETDGVWAPYWYKEVLTSTTFRPYRPKPDQVPPQFHDLWERCQAIYDELYQYRLT
ncbi:MAG: HAD family hydrolase [Planctomycetota bacterium]|nr:MAG: HAD family hydrolase [Planctomycetota bacterium]